MIQFPELNEMITLAEIQEITQQCLKLLSCTEFLRRDIVTKNAHGFAEEIFASIRKLLIASTMYQKKLICISGLQGVGKTTLMRNFYGLNGPYLNPTRGRGERIPVLITERKGISTPSMHAILIDQDSDGNYIQRELTLDVEEFAQAASGDNQKVMYLELYVPYQHTYNEGLSFVLLPGFEKRHDYWNNLIEFSVNSSDAAVFVFNETSFSNAANEQYLRKIEKTFGTNLVYAISGSDGSPDDNAEVKRVCMDVLNIPDTEADRVVCVGEYATDEKNQEWKTSLKAALEKYAYRGTQQFQRNSVYLYQEVDKIRNNLYRILDILNQDNEADIVTHHNDTLLRSFDRVVKKKRMMIEDHLKNECGRKQEDCIAKLAASFDKFNKAGYIKRMFTGGNVKEEYRRLRETVKNALDDGGKSALDCAAKAALEESLKSTCQPVEKTCLHKLIVSQTFENKAQQLLLESENTQALVNDIQLLLAENSQPGGTVALQIPNTNRVLGAIAEIGTYYFSFTHFDLLAKHMDEACYLPPQIDFSPEVMLEKIRSLKSFAFGLAGIMGIDLIGDGELNLVSQLANQLGIALPTANIAALALISIGTAASVMRDLSTMQRNEFYSALSVIRSSFDDVQMNVLKKYDQYMGLIRDRIESNLTEVSGDNRKFSVELNAKFMINYTLDLLEKIQERQRGSAYGLESALS